MNLPNKLTVLRILLVPVMVIVSFFDIPGNIIGIPMTLIIIDFIFMIASITDKLDGSIARSRNLVTNFGKFLDPIADKILVIAALLILTEMGRIPAWITIITVFREFLVSGFRLIAVEQNGKVIAANIWGKLKTVTQMLAIGILFLDLNPYFAFINGNLEKYTIGGEVLPMVINIISSVMITISVVATIFSGYDYLKGGKDLLKDK